MGEVPPSRAALVVWARLLRAQRRVLADVEAELKAAGFAAFEWYDVLVELSHADARGLRPGVLEARLPLAQYNISRLLERMSKAGLVGKTPCEDDARGHYVTLTPAGRETLHRVWPVYRDAIARHVGAKLEEEEADRLGDLLAKLIAAATAEDS